jgi:CPA1 family monovalent cation:H+ antiporter
VIASVVCGMYFSAAYSKIERRAKVIDTRDLYKDFWDIMESLLNSILFVMIGLLVLNLDVSKYIFILAPAAIIINVCARSFGVSISSILTGKKNIPGNYNVFEYVTLMTWSALKGGLSLALAFGTKEFLPKDIYDIFINVTYVTIFFTVLVQGLTVKNVYFALEKHKTARMIKNRK